MPESYDLERFVAAQAGLWEQARAELRAGEKRTHWMWFIFPQIRGLGTSATAVRYALASLGEARAYLAHPILGTRLRELTAIVTALEKPVQAVFPYPDNLKFHSCMTLFDHAGNGEPVFAEALRHCFSGQGDQATLERIR